MTPLRITHYYYQAPTGNSKGYHGDIKANPEQLGLNHYLRQSTVDVVCVLMCDTWDRFLLKKLEGYIGHDKMKLFETHSKKRTAI